MTDLRGKPIKLFYNMERVTLLVYYKSRKSKAGTLEISEARHTCP